MVDRVLALPEGTRIYVLAPVVRGRKGEYKKELAEFLRKGYQRVKVDGAFYEIGEVKPLDKKFTHDIDVVVDRLVVRGDIGARLADSLEQCLQARGRAGRGRIGRHQSNRAQLPTAAATPMRNG
jgi:excinuclease ABC subunit A